MQLLLAVLGLAVAFHPHELTRHVDFGAVPSWNALAFSIPLAMIAFTGLEIVALIMREVKKPADTFARGMVSAVLATIVLYAVIATVALTALPIVPHPGAPSGYASDVSEQYLSAPLAGVAHAVGRPGRRRASAASCARSSRSSAVLILMFSAITAFSGAARVLRGLGDTLLPAAPGRRDAPALRDLAAAERHRHRDRRRACTARPRCSIARSPGSRRSTRSGSCSPSWPCSLAVIKLRVVEPDRPRPVMMRGNVQASGAR